MSEWIGPFNDDEISDADNCGGKPGKPKLVDVGGAPGPMKYRRCPGCLDCDIDHSDTVEGNGRLHLTVLADSNLDRDWLKVIETGFGDPTECPAQYKRAIERAVSVWLETGATVHPTHACPRCGHWPSPVPDALEWILGCEHECHTYKETP